MSDAVRPDLFDDPAVPSPGPSPVSSPVSPPVSDDPVERDASDWFVPVKMAVGTELSRQVFHAMLWWPVCFATGIGLFFSLAADPPVWSGAGVFLIALSIRVMFQGYPILRTVGFVLALAAAGFCAAQVRTARVDAPILSEETGPAIVTGTVVMLEPVGTVSRVTLDRLAIDRLGTEAVPERVRIRLPASHGASQIGERIAVRGLPPISGPVGLREPGRFQGIAV